MFLAPGSGFKSKLVVVVAIAALGLGYTLAKHVPIEQVNHMQQTPQYIAIRGSRL